MEAGAVDVRQTRTFGIEGYLVRKVPIAIGLILFAVLVIAGAHDRSSDDDYKALFFGALLIAGSLAYIGYALYRRARPEKPLVELSPAGILFRVADNKELHIPWTEIQSLAPIDIDLGKGAKIRNVTAASVSREFFDANVPVVSWWQRGPGWRYAFLSRDDTVKIAFHHDVLSVPADELWNEIETRWRAFSGHPNASLLAAPWAPRPRSWFGGWRPSPAVRRAGLALLAVLALLAIWFWHWPVAWLSLPNVPSGSATAYMRELVDRSGIQARVGGKGIAVLRYSDIAGWGNADCAADIARDPNRSAVLLPYFTGRTLCTVTLLTAAGLPAVGIFELVVHTTQSPDWEGKPQEYKTLAPAALEETEVDAALCRLGSCAES